MEENSYKENLMEWPGCSSVMIIGVMIVMLLANNGRRASAEGILRPRGWKIPTELRVFVYSC